MRLSSLGYSESSSRKQTRRRKVCCHAACTRVRGRRGNSCHQTWSTWVSRKRKERVGSLFAKETDEKQQKYKQTDRQAGRRTKRQQQQQKKILNRDHAFPVLPFPSFIHFPTFWLAPLGVSLVDIAVRSRCWQFATSLLSSPRCPFPFLLSFLSSFTRSLNHPQLPRLRSAYSLIWSALCFIGWYCCSKSMLAVRHHT